MHGFSLRLCTTAVNFPAMNELEHYISTYFGLTGADMKEIASYFSQTKLKKGDFFLKPGEVCRTLSFQRSGLVRFYVDDGDQEVTQWISAKDGFVTDLSGLIFNMPSRSHIQALTDSDFYTIQQQDYVQLGVHLPQWHHLEKLFIARCFLFMEQRIFSLLSMKAEERYHWLFNLNPELFNQVPLQYLASMMGMTPETLSRIRKKQTTSLS